MGALIGLAAACAGALVWLVAKPKAPERRLRRLLIREDPRRTRGRRLIARLVRHVRAWTGAVGERKSSAQRWRDGVIELCDGMASELSAGRTPDEAFTITATLLDQRIAVELLKASPDCEPPPPGIARQQPLAAVAAAASAGPGAAAGEGAGAGDGGDAAGRSRLTEQAEREAGAISLRGLEAYASPVERLEDLAARPGAEGLRLLAACWRIGAERGGSLATVLDGLVAALRDEEAQRQEIATQLAGPRATARLLAGLPSLGLSMAAALGADPLRFLFATLPGLGCLLGGVALNVVGLWWTGRLAEIAAEAR
ncbi:type II secretion system F family protein [Actinomadura sp. 21ATH]|uniref:type II secretion system F family protein n=1 Tax=Actinomadura sp. 21ATH TaxID=1735444 RepID=UPI0035BF0BD8